LDVGCGQGDGQPWFEEIGVKYTGVTLGEDYVVAQRNNRNVLLQDFSFLDFPDNSFDMIFARHSLEHSPMPLLTLMEWNRVGKSFLCLILPQPKYWKWAGRNHYSVMSRSTALFLLHRAGWNDIWQDHEDEREYRFMCTKQVPEIYQDEDTTLEDNNETVNISE
jgi:ubiquinone/menaquinone biosynthesis C-methylase UbiE